MAIDLTKYYRVDTANVKDTKVGGRLYSAVYTEELPNGVLGDLGDFVEGSELIRKFVLPSTNVQTLAPYLVFKPEINYDESSRAYRKLGIHRNPANKAFPVVKLQNNDTIRFSEDYFTKDDEIKVGDLFVLTEDGLLKNVADKTGYKFYVEVIKVENSHLVNYIAGDGKGQPQPYKLYLVSVHIAE